MKTKNELIDEVLRRGDDFDQPFVQNSCRIIRDLKAQRDMAVEALEDVQQTCLCERSTKGFDYGDTHKLKGKPRAGARWLTPSALIEETLAKIKSDEWLETTVQHNTKYEG